MRDFKKFCRPKTTKHQEIGDVQVKLNCGDKVYVKARDYFGVRKFFKVNSVVGETTNTAGNVKVLNKAINKEVVVSPLTYINNLNKFSFVGVVGNINNSEDGNIICRNTTLNQNAIFSYNDWLNLDDDWDLTGLYGITTYEEENADDGDYVIMANGNTLIIKPEDYSKVSDHWEHVDTIVPPNNVIKYTASLKLAETSSVPMFADGSSSGLRTTLFNTSITSHTFENGVGIITFEEDVTEIKAWAFYNNINITSVTIPNSVTIIGDYAFMDCHGLTSITIPNNVTSIGKGTFGYCRGLSSVTIGSGVTNIGDTTFSNCSGLTSITISENVISIGGGVCQLCTNLEVVTALPTTPPFITNSTLPLFASTSPNLVIYVPSDSVDAYKAADRWNTYADIIQAIQ